LELLYFIVFLNNIIKINIFITRTFNFDLFHKNIVEQFIFWAKIWKWWVPPYGYSYHINEKETGYYFDDGKILHSHDIILHLTHFQRKIATAETMHPAAERISSFVPHPFHHPPHVQRSEIDRRLPGGGYNGDESGTISAA